MIWHTCEELAFNWQLTPNDPEAFNYKTSTNVFTALKNFFNVFAGKAQ